jgi:hypothetical protein
LCLANLQNEIPVTPGLIADLENMYAPPDHPVFELVPPAFESQAKIFYASMGDPIITRDNFWATYQRLLQSFRDQPVANQDLQAVLAGHDEHCRSIAEEDPGVILPGLKELRDGADAVGPAAAMIGDDSLTFMEPERADFSDSDDEIDNDDGQ